MRVKTISVSYERKFNLGDFNSLKLEATVWADLDEGELTDESIETLQGTVKSAVAKEYLELKKRLEAQKAKNVAVAEKVQLAQ